MFTADFVQQTVQSYPGTQVDLPAGDVADVLNAAKTLGAAVERKVEQMGASAGLAAWIVKEAKVERKAQGTVAPARTQADRIAAHLAANRIRNR